MSKIATLFVGLFLCIFVQSNVFGNESEKKQTPQPEIESGLPMKLLTGIRCYTQEQLNDLIVKSYGELPFAFGDGIIERPDKPEFLMVPLEIYVNPETRSYSIVVVMAEGVGCIIGSGRNFSPASMGSKI